MIRNHLGFTRAGSNPVTVDYVILERGAIEGAETSRFRQQRAEEHAKEGETDRAKERETERAKEGESGRGG